MSITISNCNQICNSPVNSSTAKMLYSFPKGQRFNQTKSTLCDKFYEPGFIQSARTTSFGFGQKYDFSKTARCSPPCNTYNLKSDFDFSRTDRKGFGFGKGRQEMKITGPLVASLKNKNPGPGTYELPNTLEKSCFTFTSKRQQVQDKQKSKIPGPGYYPVTLSINEKGKYSVSKIKNILSRNFGNTLGRKDISISQVPAPGSYDISRASLSPDGKYPLSKMQNSLTRKFGSSVRSPLDFKKQTPGPGNYKLPSQFGHYVSKKFQECIRSGKDKQNKQNLPAI